MADTGYDIPISVSASTPVQSSTAESAETVFIFGNGNNPTVSPDTDPSQSATTSAATAQGGVAGSGGSSAGTSPTGTVAGTSFNWTAIALIVLAALVVHHFFKHKA